MESPASAANENAKHKTILQQMKFRCSIGATAAAAADEMKCFMHKLNGFRSTFMRPEIRTNLIESLRIEKKSSRNRSLRQPSASPWRIISFP